MNPLKPLLIAALLSLGIPATAQTSYHVPEGYQLSDKADYMKYKQDVLDATEYLKQLPAGREVDNRREVSRFLMQWALGSPDVSVTLKQQVIGAFLKQPELLLLYTAGWTSYVLRTGDTSERAGNLAGARTVVDYYKNPRNNMPRIKKLEQWVRNDEAGTFDAYITGLWTND